MSSIKWIMFLIICVNNLDITSFNINFFEQCTKLYYVNAINNENGDIYFEFWGEENDVRYFLGKSFSTEENIKINGNEIYSINANSIWNYHESIIVNYHNSTNILTMNSKYIDYINLEDNITSSKLTKQLIGDNTGAPSFRSSLIKLQNGNYLSSIILKRSLSHKIYMTIFNFTSNNINGFQVIKRIDDKVIGYMNSTTCFQTESTYIQCSFSNVLPTNYFTVGIYDINLNEQETIHFGYLLDYTFTKIFHIKGEIGAYIFFDDRDNNVPKLFIRKLNDYKNDLVKIVSSLDYIVLNNNGRYTLDYGLFSSDAVKMDDYTFVVILTIAGDSHDLLISLCDFNNYYTGIRIRYYYINLSSINIKIDVNLRTFIFKDYLGLLFYDSNSEYPGYIFFNYPKIIDENKVDSRTIKINLNLFDNTSTKIFIFSEHLELINDIYTGQIKIKIINYSSPSLSGIIIKTSSKELYPGDIIDFDEPIIFWYNGIDIIPGEFILEFYPIVVENESSSENYGDYEEGDFEQIVYFTKYKFNLIYLVECPSNKYIYIKNEKEKYCLSSCIYDSKELYQDENENFCYHNCSYSTNGNIYLFRNTCISDCPANYIPNENNICILNEINSEMPQIIKSEVLLTQTNYISSSKETSQLIKSEEILAKSNSFLYNKEISQSLLSEEILTKSNSIEGIEEETKIFFTEKILSEDISSNKKMSIIPISDDNLPKTNFNSINGCYINIDSLINNYKIKGSILEIEELEQCSIIYYCYSSSVNIELLMKINPNLIYINFNECKNSLIKENIIEEDSEILITGKQKLTISKKASLNYFEYEIYGINGTKIQDLSKCKNSHMEITSPINNNEDYEAAISLFEQGYDIFNLSSSFYYDLCLSAYLNNSDLTLSIRQNDIMKDSKSVCLEGCIYNGVNLTTKRISCICDFDNMKKNESSKINQLEEVEENFFRYILGMINYKIIICHKLLTNIKNYYYNLGFYTGIGILAIILILGVVYYCIGKKSITIQYLHHLPKVKEKEPSIIINNILVKKNNNVELKKKYEIIENNPRKNNQKSKSLIQNNKISKLPLNEPSKRKSFIQNNNTKTRNTAQQLNKLNINNDTGKRIENNYNNSTEKIAKLNINDYNNKKISDEINSRKEQKENIIDYNDLTYSQALIKDERNIIQMFLFYLNNKFEIIQITFYPKEFSHKSLTFSLYLYELLLDLTFNALLFSDEVISQKYYNNGNLLFITSQTLSISSNIISCFIVYTTSYLVNYYSVLDAATLETKDQKVFFQIFIKISWFIYLKINIFYIIVVISGFLCLYYLFIFCAIFKKIQKNLFTNYFIGILWSFVYKIGVSILSAILRKISIYGKYKRLYYISKYIDEKI